MYKWKDHKRIIEANGLVNTKSLEDVDLRNIAEAWTLFRKLRNHLLREELIDSRADVQLVFLSSNRIEAFALKGDPGKYAICLTIGMMRAIWNVLLLSLCDNKIFPNYGGEYGTYKVKRRISRRLVFGPAIIPAKNSQQHISGKELRKYQDITPSRKELCELLFNVILDYLFYHEAMHITRDHFAFKSIYNSLDYISEAEVSRNNMIKFFQFLEIDADIVALNFMLPTNPEISQFDRLTKFTQGDFVFGQMFSNIIIQQLFDFDDQVTSIRKQWKGDHPPPMIRSMLYDNLLYRFFVQQNLLPKEEVRDQQSKAWWEASRIAIKLGFPSGRWHGKTMDGISTLRVDKLINEFNSFQEIIERSHHSGKYTEIRKAIKSLK